MGLILSKACSNNRDFPAMSDTKTKKKPKLNIIPAHPEENRPIANLGERLSEVIIEYANAEHKEGRPVTFAEIVGTLEFLKHRYLTKDI